MPNWCENEVRVYGEAERIDALLEAVKGESDFDFDCIVPFPQELNGIDHPAMWEHKERVNRKEK